MIFAFSAYLRDGKSAISNVWKLTYQINLLSMGDNPSTEVDVDNIIDRLLEGMFKKVSQEHAN